MTTVLLSFYLLKFSVNSTLPKLLAGLQVVIGHGFGLDPSTIAETMLAATSHNVLPGLECVGPLKVVDTIATTGVNNNFGSLPLPHGPGIGIALDEYKLKQYAFDT